MMRKRIFLVTIMICSMVLACACGKKEAAKVKDVAPSSAEAENNTVGLSNPWTDTDADGFLAATGVELNVPEGATDVVYRVLDAEKLGEMQFVLDGTAYVARVSTPDKFEDISGMYYEWTYEGEGKVSYNDAKVYSHTVDDRTDAMLCLWYDVVPGIMYSVSATTENSDLNGLDIEVIASQVYAQMQGEVG